MNPTKHYIDVLKALARSKVDHLQLGELAAEQRHKNIERFILERGGRLRCPECLAHDLKSALEQSSTDLAKLVCPLCGFTVDRPDSVARNG